MALSTSKFPLAQVLLLLMAISFAVACGTSGEFRAPETPATDSRELGAPAPPSQTPSPGPVELQTETPTSIPDSTPTVTPVPTPQPRFSGFDFQIATGDFWVYRWSTEDRSCAQRSGCSTDEDSGVFRIELGTPRSTQGATAYEMILTGEAGTYAPPWRYIAVEDMKILGSNNGSSFTVLFDGLTGAWAGSGFFKTRFEATELSSANQGAISDSETIAEWEGVHAGPAIVVGRADSQSECEMIEGLRICPREESHSFTEREWYRPGVGAVGYTYQTSSSYSGGGFFSSYSSKENIGLIASSLRGDADIAIQTNSGELVEFVEEFLTGAINAEIDSYRNNDDSYISEFMIGEPLRRVRANLDSLSAEGLVYVPLFNPSRSSTKDIRVVTAEEIEVDRCEVWSGSYYTESDGSLLQEEPIDLVAQTITLKSSTDGWHITKIDFYDDSSFC